MLIFSLPQYMSGILLMAKKTAPKQIAGKLLR